MSVAEITNKMATTSIKNDNDPCSLCGYDLSDPTLGKPVVALECNHRFHATEECILGWFKNLETLIKTKNKNYKNERQCPYCRKYGGWLQLPIGEKPIRGIHKEYHAEKKKLSICNAPYTTKSGNCKNKGKTSYGGYCGMHKKWQNINPKNQ